MLFRRKSQPVAVQAVDTLSTNTIRGNDRNHDGIPDYLQRTELPSVVKSTKEYSQWESDVVPEIEEWIMHLRGYEKSADGSSYKPSSPPIINEIGINGVKSFLIPVVNKHAINTSLKEDQVNEIVYYNTRKFIRWLKHNYKLIGCRLSYLTPVAIQYEHFLYMILSRSIGDKQRIHLSERMRITGRNEVAGSFPG